MISAMKLARIKKEMSQIDLWIKTGIPQWRLSLLERGIRPKPEEAKIVAEVLEEKQEEIFPSFAQGKKN
ncbi:MAG TPA: helix-turn-helix transcriptional regulator [Smithella sp.]|nr:helix-turn-helix transcriptional regulator [Smithella sp.]